MHKGKYYVSVYGIIYFKYSYILSSFCLNFVQQIFSSLDDVCMNLEFTEICAIALFLATFYFQVFHHTPLLVQGE